MGDDHSRLRAINAELLEALERAEPALDEILEREDIDSDECPRGDFVLCGSGWCHAIGCVVGKLAAARAAIARAKEE